MKQLILICSILFKSNLIFSQSIPSDYFSYQSKKIFYDTGIDWNSLTIFGPIRFDLKKQDQIIKREPSLYFDGMINCNIGNNVYALSGFGHFKYKNHFYGYVYPSLINKTSNNLQFGVENNLSNNDNNYAGLGFENSWVILQVGKGKESWGAGEDIELALSDNSKPYNYFLLGSDYGKVRVRYIYGFLENVERNINRYLTARGFEWTNKKSIIIGVSETVIYSGENRSFDIGYLNPISTHLENELNNRLNILGDNNSNAVWQLHLDFLLNNNFRFSLNYLLDEFVIDPNIEIGKEHGEAYSIRIAYTPFYSSTHHFTLIGSIIYVGTPTFRHGNGTNNFVHKNIPLGWERGSDTQEFNFGFNYFNNKNIVVKILSGYYEMGEESIVNRVFDPYSDYLKGTYPSGNVSSEFYFKSFYSYFWNDNSFSLMLWLNWSQNKGSEMQLGFQVPFNFLLN